VDVLHRPLQDHGVGKLQDEAVGLAPREAEGLRSVPGHPHVELSVLDPRDLHLYAGEVDRATLGQLLDDVHGLF
jgi:hypothetical protein